MGIFKKKEKKEKKKYYSLDRIKEYNARYNMIYGERSNGKTYAVLKELIECYVKKGSQFAYIRRWEEDFRGKRGAGLFDGLVRDGVISELTDGEYNSIYFWSGRFYLSKFDKENLTRVNSPEPCGYAFAISTMEHDKSSSYPFIRNIIFDEFLTRTTYLVDEFVLFCNVLSTIIRDRDDVIIYMLGNTVNQYCPYFKEMGLKNIKRQKPGEIQLYTYGDSDLLVAVEYTGGEEYRESKPSDVYFAFDNPKLRMITNGGWELDIYPHCPMKFLKNDIKFVYFIEFDEELLQCEIVKSNRCVFTFIHRKTTPIKNEDKDMIFTQRYDPRSNWRRVISKPFDNIGKFIWEQYKKDNVYYQDNEVGDMVMNYLQWCEQQ